MLLNKDINIIPYTTVDGIRTFRDSEIKELVRKVINDGISDLLFHDGSISSVEEFVELMKGDSNLLFVVTLGDTPCGLFWINRIERTHCYCHFVAFKEVWGTGVPVAAGRKAMELLFTTFHFEVVMGLLPSSNRFAIEYLKRVGLEVDASIPSILWNGESQHSVPGTFLHITKEMLDNACNNKSCHTDSN